MVVRRNMTMAKFKKQAGKKLGTKPKKVFLSSGAEISDVDEMQNDDMLYISQGEPYYKNPGACSLTLRGIVQGGWSLRICAAGAAATHPRN